MKNEKQIQLVRCKGQRVPARVKTFFARPAIDPKAEKAAAAVLKDIRSSGDAALVRYAKKFDKVSLTPNRLKVTAKELRAAENQVDAAFKRAAKEAHKRIAAFARAGRRADWSIKTPRGGELGERFMPLQRVGAYIPGGASPLASTALMTVTLARIAGVPERVACTPAGKSGHVDPNILYALDLAGATEIYRVGGIHSIGAMAYGTGKIKKVQKIVGPGGPYVTAAKRLVYGEVDLDMIAGPSEIAVLADSKASAKWIAADLLSQAEHGTGLEKSLFVTTSAPLAEKVRQQLFRQAQALPRKEMIFKVLKEGTLLVVVDNLDIGVGLINEFAPEHFELLVKSPKKWLPKFKTCGAIFAGPWTPESAGDFAAGPSHVLPTGGAAAVFSGLSVDSFCRRSSYLNLKRADLTEMLPVIEAFSRIEGLEAHARSARVRFDEPS